MPTPTTPFVNPISAEESSANIDPPNKTQDSKQSEPVQIKVNLTPKKDEKFELDPVIDRKATASTDMTEAEYILDMTRKLQEQLYQKRMQAAPPANAKPDENADLQQSSFMKKKLLP